MGKVISHQLDWKTPRRNKINWFQLLNIIKDINFNFK